MVKKTPRAQIEDAWAAQHCSDNLKPEWLCSRLHLYLNRWLGFAKAPEIGVKATLRGEAFELVVSAIDLLDQEVLKNLEVKKRSIPYWDEFRNSVEWIKRTADQQDISLIEITFKRFGEAAFSKSYVIEDLSVVPLKDTNITGIE